MKLNTCFFFRITILIFLFVKTSSAQWSGSAALNTLVCNDLGKQIDLSLAYYQSGEYEKSIEACKKALTFQPDYAAAYSNMAAAYNQLKQWDNAIDACNKALKIDPQFKLALGNLNWAKDEKAKSKK